KDHCRRKGQAFRCDDQRREVEAELRFISVLFKTPPASAARGFLFSALGLFGNTVPTGLSKCCSLNGPLIQTVSLRGGGQVKKGRVLASVRVWLSTLNIRSRVRLLPQQQISLFYGASDLVAMLRQPHEAPQDIAE
ncbi:MAG: hypothetical protein ACK4OI_06290, partial [Rhizobium oryzihabitans]